MASRKNFNILVWVQMSYNRLVGGKVLVFLGLIYKKHVNSAVHITVEGIWGEVPKLTLHTSILLIYNISRLPPEPALLIFCSTVSLFRCFLVRHCVVVCVKFVLHRSTETPQLGTVFDKSVGLFFLFTVERKFSLRFGF